jgi:ParB family chromosome partitioning protein
MTVKRTGLGRGLDALLGDVELVRTVPAEADEGLRLIAVDLLRRGAYQPRTNMHQESLEDLARSIKSQGLVQPIVVRPLPGRYASGAAHYEIVAGERRWRAAQMAGLEDIPAIVREMPDSAAIAVALIENIQRENLNPLEEAQALRRLIDEFEVTHQEAADAVGRSRTAVSNLLRLLELGADAKALVESGQLEMGHARALLAIVDTRMQAEVAQLVAKKSLSVRETERLVKRMLDGKGKQRPRSGTLDPDIRRLQDDLSERLGARVHIQHGTKGRGKLIVGYNSLDELEGILGHIK